MIRKFIKAFRENFDHDYYYEGPKYVDDIVREDTPAPSVDYFKKSLLLHDFKNHDILYANEHFIMTGKKEEEPMKSTADEYQPWIKLTVFSNGSISIEESHRWDGDYPFDKALKEDSLREQCYAELQPSELAERELRRHNAESSILIDLIIAKKKEEARKSPGMTEEEWNEIAEIFKDGNKEG